jgi:hypothetical protein
MNQRTERKEKKDRQRRGKKGRELTILSPSSTRAYPSLTPLPTTLPPLPHPSRLGPTSLRHGTTSPSPKHDTTPQHRIQPHLRLLWNRYGRRVGMYGRGFTGWRWPNVCLESEFEFVFRERVVVEKEGEAYGGRKVEKSVCVHPPLEGRQTD